MVKIMEAVFDGSVLLPQEDLPLEANTRVRITVETLPPSDQPASFLNVARSLHLEGPPEWSQRIDDYLYGEQNPQDG